jgi:predicted AAA+ superfamily ATPase
MPNSVLVKSGVFNGQTIENLTFPLLTEYTGNGRNGWISVDGSEHFNRKRCRIHLNGPHNIEYSDEVITPMATATPSAAKKQETDEEIMTRIGERFEILEDMAQAVKEGDVRAMIVVGPPGVGKSYGIQKKLDEASLYDEIAGKVKYQVVKGAMTALGLYAKLYEFADSGSVLVFDDCDSILMDELSLNILKAALDSGKKRTIHWNADSSMLHRAGIPNKFDFKGGVIFITNLKFENIRSKKLQDHLGALQSRCHYIDLTLDTEHDKYLRIRQIAESGKLFKDYDMDESAQAEILHFMKDNARKFREMSLRTALKLADLRKSQPTRWQRVAEITVMRNGG